MTIREFIEERLTSMANRPTMYAGNTESFITQLCLLVEISWIGSNVSFYSSHKINSLMAELCGKEHGCVCPNKPIEENWAKSRVEIARKHLP